MLAIGSVVAVVVISPYGAHAPKVELPPANFTSLISPVGQLDGRRLELPAAALTSSQAGRKPATRSLVVGSYQQVLINLDRRSAGLAPLSWSTCLAGVAVTNARRMAAQGYISHTNGAWLDLDCHLGVQGGENVGWWSGGITDGQLNSMFMASPDHRANIMGPYHFVATSWAVASNGFAYIAVEFA